MTKRKESGLEKVHQAAPIPKGCLLAIGGGESKKDKAKSEDQAHNIEFEGEQILKFFKDHLKGEDPLVAFIPTASGEPEEMAKEYTKVLHSLGIKQVKVLDIRTREDANKEEHYEVIKQANGIYFGGGDQLRLTAILGGTRLLQLMKERYTNDPVLIAGTSAGAYCRYQRRCHGFIHAHDLRSNGKRRFY